MYINNNKTVFGHNKHQMPSGWNMKICKYVTEIFGISLLRLKIHGWKRCGCMSKLPDAWEVVIFTQSEVYNELLWLYSVWLVSAAEVTSTYYRVFFSFAQLQPHSVLWWWLYMESRCETKWHLVVLLLEFFLNVHAYLHAY